MEKKHIVCFGDSNTHGCDAELNIRFDEDQRWTCLLQKQLGNDYLILEEGLPGRTTCFPDPLSRGVSGIDYIHPCLLSHKTIDLLVIMLGTNDTKERFGSSAACIALGLKRLLDEAIAITDAWPDGKANILVITPKNIDKRYEETEVMGVMGKGCAEKSAGLAAEYQKIADLMNCAHLDANTIVTEQNHTDFMHLTAVGHQQLADALTELIPSLL